MSKLTDQISNISSPTNAGITALTAIAAAEATHEIKILEFAGRKLVSLPAGRTLDSLEQYLPYPARTKGNHDVNDAESFHKTLKRFESSPTNVFLSKSKLLIQAVFNGPTDTNPGWSDHYASWQLKLHRDFKAWIEFCKQSRTQLEFMEFLEDHLVDIVQSDGSPSQSAMESVVSGLEVTLDSKFEARRDLHNGNYVLKSNHESTPSQEVPRTFKIGVSIFEGLKEAYIVTIRLRYRVTEGKLMFTLAIQHYDAIIDESWDTVTKTITDRLPESVPFINVP